MPLTDVQFDSEQDILNVSGSISASIIDPGTGEHVKVDGDSLKVTGSVFVINPSGGGSGGTVDQGLSGSIPWKITGSVSVEQPINVEVDNFPAVQTITGSVVIGEEPVEVSGTVGLVDGTTVIVSSTPVPSDVTLVVRDYVKNGGSSDLIVNGSGTPVEFDFVPTSDTALSEIRMVLSSGRFDFDGASFCRGSSLANGVLLELQSSGSLVELANVQVNEEFLAFPSQGGAVLQTGGATDVMAVGFTLGGNVTLFTGTSDYVRVTIRDNLTIGSRGVDYFQCAVYGIESI